MSSPGVPATIEVQRDGMRFTITLATRRLTTLPPLVDLGDDKPSVSDLIIEARGNTPPRHTTTDTLTQQPGAPMPTILPNANATMIADRAANTRTLLSWEPRYPTKAPPKQASLLTNTRATQGAIVVVGLNPSMATAVAGDGVLSAVDANPTAAGARTEAAHNAALAQGLEPGAIMLDATLNRINRAAAEMGYSRVVMLNAYPYRATTPEGLWAWEEATPSFNMRDYIAELDKVLEDIKPAVVVAAWGSSMPQRIEARAAHAGRMALLKMALKRHAPLKCWGLLGNGAPAHPLRLSAERLRQLDDLD